MATTVELRHWDSGGKNFYVFRDASSTGRWQILSWDLDGIFSGGSDTKGDFITPDITGGNKLYKSLFEVPEIKDMYFRRLRTLHDQYLAGNNFVTRFDQLTVGKDADRVLNKNKWGGLSLSSARQKVVNGVQERRNQIAAHTNATEVPTSQSANPNIVINEIHPQPATATGNEEYLELYNPSDDRGRGHLGLGDQGRRVERRRLADPDRHGHPEGRLRRLRQPRQRLPGRLPGQPLHRRAVPRRPEQHG